MMLFAIFIALVASVTSEEALQRDKRFAAAYAGVPWPFWPGFPFGSGVYVGPYGYPSSRETTPPPQAAASDPAQQFSPWGRSFVPFPYFPFPVFQMPKPWYEGENVCKTVKYDNSDQDNEFDEFLRDSDFASGDYNFNHKECRGSDTRYMCIERRNVNGQIRREATKYFCCYGFVRNPYGPGCIESSDKSKKQPSVGDKNYYDFGSSSSSMSSSSSLSNTQNVDKVPPQ